MTGPGHGYEIRAFLRDGLGATWRIPTSQFYAQLKRLEEQGLLISSLEPHETRPSRRVFALTDAGRDAFMEWVLAPTEHVCDLRVDGIGSCYSR